MSMKPVRAVLLAAIALLTSCGSNSKPDLTGTWTFSAQSKAFNYSVSGSAAIQQTNQSVTGKMTLKGSPCATSATLQGSVSNNSVTVAETDPQTFSNLATLIGTINGDSLSGTYSSPLIGCTNGDFGTWTATKQ